MTNAEFDRIVSDFDSFMEDHGYLTMEKIANKVGITLTAMYSHLQSKNIPGVIRVANKWYVPSNWERKKFRNAPDNFEPVGKTARKWFVSPYTVKHFIHDGRIDECDCIKINGCWFVRKGLEYEEVKSRPKKTGGERH